MPEPAMAVAKPLLRLYPKNSSCLLLLFSTMSQISPSPLSFRGGQGFEKPPVSTTQKAQWTKYRLYNINRQNQQDEATHEIHYLISKTHLFGGLSFGVRRQVAAFQSGAKAPHSKKGVFSALSSKICVIHKRLFTLWRQDLSHPPMSLACARLICPLYPTPVPSPRAVQGRTGV